ncbi:MAG: hypothetical protein U0736_17095 [Gemmataceae bacterium]
MSRHVLRWLAGVALFAVGCSTHAQRLHGVRDAFYSGDLATAELKIDEGAKKKAGEADVLELDRAAVLLTAGKPREAEQVLRKVRDQFDQFEQKDAAEGVLAMLTDDQALAYAGDDHEKVLIRVYLALANLLGDGGDAAAYALQVADKQRQIIDKGAQPDGKNPKQGYAQVAVGAYLHAALREATHQNYDDAARSLQLVCQWEPAFAPGKADLDRVKQGHHSGKGNGVLYLFTLVGRGPYKEEKLEIPSTAALLVADRILSIAGKRSLPPTVAPIKVPCVVRPVNVVQAVAVNVDGVQRGQTATLTDVGRLATQQAEAMHPYVLGRAIARRVVKKGAVYAVKEVTKQQKGDLSNLALDVAGVVWEATESADTRCWGLLPDKIQVLRLELPAGSHQITLQPVAGDGRPCGPAETTAVEVRDGRNSYALANFPTSRLVGAVVTSDRPAPRRR